MLDLKEIDRRIARVEGWLLCAILWTVIGFVFFNLGLRALYTHGQFQWANRLLGFFGWSDILVRLLVLWLGLLGASLLTADGRHLRIDVFAGRLPRLAEAWRELVLSLVSFGICGIMVGVSVRYLRLEASYGGSVLPGFPAWAAELILPLGFLLMGFRFLLQSLDRVLHLVHGARS